MCLFSERNEKIRTHEIKNWIFLCKDNSLTCFEKAHKYYIPNNLFKKGKTLHNYSLSKIDGKATLFMERKKALTGLKNWIPSSENKWQKERFEKE